jgi:hypothetical protein
MRYGTNTPAALTMVGTNSRGAAFLEDNVAFDVSDAAVSIASPAISVLSEKPTWPEGLVALPSDSVVDWVVAHAGARPKDRDAVDQRLVTDFMTGGGSFLNSQDDVGGYPTVEATMRPLEVPTDDVEGWLARLAAELE